MVQVPDDSHGSCAQPGHNTLLPVPLSSHGAPSTPRLYWHLGSWAFRAGERVCQRLSEYYSRPMTDGSFQSYMFCALPISSSFAKLNRGKECNNSLFRLLCLFSPGGWKGRVLQHIKSMVSLILMFALNWRVPLQQHHPSATRLALLFSTVGNVTAPSRH